MRIQEKPLGGAAGFRLVVPLLALLVAACSGRFEAPASFPEGSGALVVEAAGFTSDRGRAIASLFSSAEGFPDAMGGGVRTLDAPITVGHARFVFPGVPWGEYAVSVLHDEDGDGRMRSNWMGMAREGHGVSNAPEVRFGPPDFDQARFVFMAPERVLPIRIRYAEERGPEFKRR